MPPSGALRLGGWPGRVAEVEPDHRAVELKRAYDPTNVFRLNQKIAP
jgi:hypothetical protein